MNKREELATIDLWVRITTENLGCDRQSGTREETLRDIYEQDELGAKIVLAKHLEARREFTKP